MRILLSLLLALPLSAQSLQQQRWDAAKVRPEKRSEVNRIVDRIQANKSRYDEVARVTGVPTHAIGALHNMEASGSFRLHLHEGSPLTGRTRWVPKGRPTWGKPPFRWEDSAVDALRYDKMERVNWSSLPASLQGCEAFNGLGYQKYHPETPSQYIWSGTTVERRGKYSSDGKWDRMAVSSQIGVAAIWKTMEQRNLFKL